MIVKKVIFLLLFILGCSSYGQEKISFEYDEAGNQIKRWYCSFCPSRNSNYESIKEITELKSSDMQKFHPEDEFSYYPNPVKEELYLKWPNDTDKKIKAIALYNMAGQVLKQYINLENQESQNIPFSNFPAATYIVVLEYTNGEQKSINILKKQ